jgi:hypothetical protein
VSAQGPDGPRDVEYLTDQEAARPRSGSGRKRAAVVAGAAALLVLGGSGAYGLWQFMDGGDSAATAVPADALGYFSLDLDPSGGQKVAAYETMRKFPVLKEQLGLDSDEDPRRWVVEAINNGADCEIDFEEEVAPWLGDKVAFSAVDGEEEPEPFFVLQVTDADAADEGVARLVACGGDDEEHGTAMVGDFMVVAPRAELAEDIATDAEESSLADDETFQDRLSDAGDQGIVTGYLAPRAVEVMLEEAESTDSSGIASPDDPAGASSGLAPDQELPVEPVPGEMTESMVPPVGGAEVDFVRDYLEDFAGAAMHIRFAEEGVEMEMAASGLKDLEDLKSGASGMDDLPGSTAIAYGLGVGPESVDMMEDAIRGGMSEAEYEAEVQRFEDETGIAFPEDVKTLLGDGLSLAVDGSIDVEAIGRGLMSGTAEGVSIPAGLRIVSDDTDAVLEVTDKLQALVPPGMPVRMEVEEGEGAVAVGVDAEYVSRLAGKGDLGASEAFQATVPDVDDSLGGLYVDFDAESWLDELVGQEDPEALDNVKPLSSLGMSATVEDDDSGRMLLRLTTD